LADEDAVPEIPNLQDTSSVQALVSEPQTPALGDATATLEPPVPQNISDVINDVQETPSLLNRRLVLSVSGLTRQQGGALALDGIDLELKHGEILVLLGDNGSGKTSLVNILAGDDVADYGTVMVAQTGHPDKLKQLRRGSRPAVLKAGVGIMRHEPALASSLTGLQNIAIGARSFWRPTLNYRSLRTQLTELRRRFELTVEIDVPVTKLAGGERMLIEFLKMTLRGFPILILDEPTESLTPLETTSLFKALKMLAAEGRSILLTTCRPEDALAVANRIAVLREGRKVTEVAVHTTDQGILTALMAGRVLTKTTPAPHPTRHSVLEFSLVDSPGIGESPALHQVSFSVRAGEIVGVAGTSRHGQDTLVALVAGVLTPLSGQLRLFGRTPKRSDPALFMRAGVGKALADYRRDGYVGEMTIIENLVMERIRSDDFSQNGFVDRRAIRNYANWLIAAYNIDCDKPDKLADTLSAATARRLLLARMFDGKPHLILAQEPTRGLDLSRRQDVHRRLITEREDDAAILLISGDIDEVLTLSDYISVIHRGHMSVPQPTGAFDKRSIGLMMGGHGSVAQDWSGWGSDT